MHNAKWHWNENRKHQTHKITKNQKHFITPLPHPIYESSTDLLPQHVLRQTPWYLTRLYVKHPPTSPHSMCCARLPGLLSPITNQGLNCTLEWVARAGIVLVKVQHISIPSGAPIFWRCLWQRNAKWYEKSPGYPLGNRNGLYYFFFSQSSSCNPLYFTYTYIQVHSYSLQWSGFYRILLTLFLRNRKGKWKQCSGETAVATHGGAWQCALCEMFIQDCRWRWCSGWAWPFIHFSSAFSLTQVGIP